MRSLIIGVSLLALMAPTAYAQQAPKPAVPPPGAPMAAPKGVAPQPVAPRAAPTAQTDVAKYLVFFDWDKATLTPEARRIIASAAEEYKRTGAAKIVATGHTDLSGTPQYNLELSERRADAVKAELVGLGVPAGVITTIGKGEEDPLVPTKDGVREAQNRRVEIVIPRPPKVAETPRPAPAPAAAPPPPPPPPPPALKWAATLGSWYGYNIREKDGGNPQKSSSLVGPDLRIGYSLTRNWSIFAEGTAFNAIGTSQGDGWGGRGVGGFSHQWNSGAWHPFIGPHFGYIGGKGAQDGALIGPEVGVNYDVADKWFLYGRAGCDHDFRNDLGQGIINGSIGVGARW
jgi:outer membrane protein OmpA-like peptidoglycan-associated protein